MSGGRDVKIVQAAGLAVSVLLAAFVAWLYVTQPRTIQELKTAAAVSANVYAIDAARFELGAKAFRERQFAVAIAHFTAADPALRDAKTQFLIASAHFEMGKGRIADDDAEFTQALAAVDRCLAASPNGTFTLDDPSFALEYRSAELLRERLRNGLEVTPGDFNPFASGSG